MIDKNLHLFATGFYSRDSVMISWEKLQTNISLWKIQSKSLEKFKHGYGTHKFVTYRILCCAALVYNSFFFSEQLFYRNYLTLDSHTNDISWTLSRKIFPPPPLTLTCHCLHLLIVLSSLFCHKYLLICGRFFVPTFP